MSAGARTRTLVVQAAVSALALAAVAWWAARQPLPDLPSLSAALPGMALALGFYAVGTLLRGERWAALLNHDGTRLRRLDAYALTTVNYMGNNTLPARAGDIMKVLLTARETGAPRSRVAGVLVAERLLDVVALGLVFGGVVVVAGLPLGLPWWVVAVAIAGVGVAAGAALALGRRRHAEARRMRALLAALLEPSRRLWSLRGALALAASVAIWLLEGGTYAVLGGVAGFDTTLVDGLYVMALTNLVALVPAAPGYVGTFDAALLLGVGLVTHATHAAALAYVVLVRFVLFVPITLVGFAVLVGRYGAREALGALRPAQSAA